MKRLQFDPKLCGTPEYPNVVPLWGKHGENEPYRVMNPWETEDEDFFISSFGLYPAPNKLGEHKEKYLKMLDEMADYNTQSAELTRRISFIQQAQDVLSLGTRTPQEALNFIIEEVPELGEHATIGTCNLKKYILINGLTINEYQMTQAALEAQYNLSLYARIRDIKDFVNELFPDGGYGKFDES